MNANRKTKTERKTMIQKRTTLERMLRALAADALRDCRNAKRGGLATAHERGLNFGRYMAYKLSANSVGNPVWRGHRAEAERRTLLHAVYDCQQSGEWTTDAETMIHQQFADFGETAQDAVERELGIGKGGAE